MQAVLDKLDATPINAADELFKAVGMTLVSSIGGASGPLYGTFFLRFGTTCGPGASFRPTTWSRRFVPASKDFVAGGKPELGDKTMFDSLHPALEALDDAINRDCRTARRSAPRGRPRARGRDDTIPMVARKGRASYLGERSAGHQDRAQRQQRCFRGRRHGIRNVNS